MVPSEQDKAGIVAESLKPGVIVAEVGFNGKLEFSFGQAFQAVDLASELTMAA